METQNVSAQLYFKQLPEDRDAASYNCQDTYPNLSTCVDNISTDAQIETAFQKQLNLSEYYKSPEVFDTMKREFTDQTMDGQNQPVSTEQPQPKPPAVPTVIPVGPTDFLNKFIKESFGSTTKNVIVLSLVVLFIIGVIILSIYLYYKEFKRISSLI
jgi:hypothetical protein